MTENTLIGMAEIYCGFSIDDVSSDEICESIFAHQGQYYTAAISAIKELGEAVKLKRETLSYKGPFFDVAFAFVVETDSSGNNVQSESLVHTTLKDSYEVESISQYYDSLTLALGLTSEYQIYDSTYTGIATSGSGKVLYERDIGT